MKHIKISFGKRLLEKALAFFSAGKPVSEIDSTGRPQIGSEGFNNQSSK